ncbi:rod shape-determining protein RodA [Peptostreptococcaceae bacterium oral taxon 081]|nr:rod shape-determining protein RodA [Peptostreptococcaceae bacterium oral taxon 081]
MDSNKGFDKILLLIVTILFLIGEVLIASAIHVPDGASPKRLIVQFGAFMLGIVMIFAMKMINYDDFKRYDKHIYIISILSLLLVYVPGLGKIMGGARGWIDLKIMYFQPIEIAKIGFILVFAKYLEKNSGNINTLKDIVKAFIIPMPIILLLLAQPDLGGAIVFFCIIFGMLFLAQINMKVVNRAIIVTVLTFPLIYLYVLDKILKPYQMSRIKDFFAFSSTATADNYQVFRSIIAIASGGIFGQGAFSGTQNNLGFLSVSDSDFIFSVCGEEYGIMGMFIVIGIYFLFMSRMLGIAMSSKDLYGSLIIVGVLSMFLYQFIQNIGMAIGIMPVTGVPLPFVSYGGSSMLMSMIAIGLIENVASKRRKINF